MQVKLPEGAVAMVNGVPVEIVLGIVKMPPAIHQQLSQHFQEELPQVVLGGQPADMGQATPFGKPFPGYGMAGGFPVPMGGAMPHPAYPNQPVDQDEPYLRLSFARQLLDTFMHMRYHMIDAAGIPDDEEAAPGEEWKQQRMAANAHVFKFTDSETKLYASCCNALAEFLDDQAPEA